MNKELLSTIAGLIFIAGFIPYAIDIIRGKTKPAKASWIIWATLDTITLAGMWAENSLNGQIKGAVLGAWIITILALKYGEKGWTRLEKFCLGGAVLGIALWAIFNSPIMALTTSVSVVFLGSIPTFISAWQDPRRESKLAWTIFWISCIFAFLAIPEMDLKNAMQPVTFFLIESIVMYILFNR